MQRMSEVIRGSLARSLRTLEEEDRLAAALPVVCGTALAAHCMVEQLDSERTLHLRVDAPEWLTSLLSMRNLLQHDLQRVAGVSLAGVHFIQAGSTADRSSRRSANAPLNQDAGPERPASKMMHNRVRRPA